MQVRSFSSVAVNASNPEVLERLNSLAVVDVSKVFKAKVEPLHVPYYKLLTLEELEKVSSSSKLKSAIVYDPLPEISIHSMTLHLRIYFRY